MRTFNNLFEVSILTHKKGGLDMQSAWNGENGARNLLATTSKYQKRHTSMKNLWHKIKVRLQKYSQQLQTFDGKYGSSTLNIKAWVIKIYIGSWPTPSPIDCIQRYETLRVN